MIDSAAVYLQILDRSIRMLIARSEESGTRALSEADRRLLFSVLEQALDTPEVWESCRQLVVTVANQMEQAGHRQDWRQYLCWALEQSERNNEPATSAHLLCYLGILAREETNLEEARETLARAIERVRCADQPSLLAKCLNRAAYVAAAEREFDHALALVEESRNYLSPTDLEMGYCWQVQGFVAELQRRWKLCIEHYARAARIYQGHHEFRRSAVCHGNMAIGYWRLGDYEKAILFSRKAIRQLEELGDHSTRPSYQMNLACMLRELGHFEDALATMRLAESGFRRINSRMNLARVHFNSGLIYRDLHDYAEAEAAICAGIQQFEALGDVAEIVNALDDLALLYRLAGRTDEADQTFRRALHTLERMAGDPVYPVLMHRITEHMEMAA